MQSCMTFKMSATHRCGQGGFANNLIFRINCNEFSNFKFDDIALTLSLLELHAGLQEAENSVITQIRTGRIRARSIPEQSSSAGLPVCPHASAATPGRPHLTS